MELKELGLTQEQIFEAVVNKISSDLLQKPIKRTDEDGTEYDDYENTPYCQELRKQIKNKIDSTIVGIVEKHVLPNAEQSIKNIVLQKTNQWGEPKGDKSLTFVEYLTQRAESFMLDEVNFEGKTRKESHYSSWTKSGTRIVYMVNNYLQYHIETWAKNALTEANKTLVEGLQKTVEIKLQEVLRKLKVTFK